MLFPAQNGGDGVLRRAFNQLVADSDVKPAYCASCRTPGSHACTLRKWMCALNTLPLRRGQSCQNSYCDRTQGDRHEWATKRRAGISSSVISSGFLPLTLRLVQPVGRDHECHRIDGRARILVGRSDGGHLGAGILRPAGSRISDELRRPKRALVGYSAIAWNILWAWGIL